MVEIRVFIHNVKAWIDLQRVNDATRGQPDELQVQDLKLLAEGGLGLMRVFADSEIEKDFSFGDEAHLDFPRLLRYRKKLRCLG